MTKENSNKIFVSRELTSSSVLRQYLESLDYSLLAKSLIRFSHVAFEAPKKGKLFFYSKTAVKYFFDNLPQGLTYSDQDIGIFGNSTANYVIEQYGISPSYIGQVKAIETAEDLKDWSKGKVINFIVGRQSLRSVQKELQDFIDWREIVVYDQDLKEVKAMHKSHYQIAVLTSPLNVDGFIKNDCTASYHVAIGHTTGNKLKSYQISPVIASLPSEAGLKDAVQSLITKM